MFPEVTGSDTKVMSFHRKWPGQGCRRPTNRVLGAFRVYRAVSHRRCQSWLPYATSSLEDDHEPQ